MSGCTHSLGGDPSSESFDVDVGPFREGKKNRMEKEKAKAAKKLSWPNTSHPL